MARLRYNGLTATLGADLLTAGTTITFASALTHSNGVAVPTITGSDYIPLSILASSDPDSALAEVVYLTAYTSGATTGTVTRGQESTEAGDRSSGAFVVNAPTSVDLSGFVSQGDKFRQGSRDLMGYQYVYFQSYEDATDGMVIWTQKVGVDSTDENIDGAVIVKHAKGYVDTPGYADTLQVYSLAGSSGTIVGNNNFVELGPPPYSIPATPTPNGYVRFELGPRWPASEVARLNNRGDLIVGWTTRTTGNTYTQSGTTVTRTSGTGNFTADDVGAYLLWTGTVDGRCDRITGYTSATQVTVETSRTLGVAAAAEVRVPRTVVRYDGTVETSGGFVIKGRPGQTGNLLEVEKSDGTTAFSVDSTGTVTPSGGSGATFSGCALTRSATQTIAASTETPVTWDGEAYDTDGYHDTATNTSRITIPAGSGTRKYLIGASIGLLGMATGKAFSTYLRKNGAFMSGGSYTRATTGAAGDLGLTFTVMAELTAGDYIECMAYHTDASARSLDTSVGGAAFWIERRS